MFAMNSRPAKPQSVEPEPEDFDELGRHFAYMFWMWKVWKQLYFARDVPVLGSCGQTDLMGDFAPDFFGLVKQMLIDKLVLEICKVTDDHQFGKRAGRRNLSVRLFLELNPNKVEASKVADARAMYDELDARLGPFRARRNKLIAHWDLAAAHGAYQLPGITDTDIDSVMATIERMMHCMRVADAHVHYQRLITRTDGESVIRLLCYAKLHCDRCDKEGRPFL